MDERALRTWRVARKSMRSPYKKPRRRQIQNQ